jgi:hypothetical protein
MLYGRNHNDPDRLRCYEDLSINLCWCQRKIFPYISRKSGGSKTTFDFLLVLDSTEKTGESVLSRYMGHLLTENRNGLVVDVRLTQATGKAERDAAFEMLGRGRSRHRSE